MEPDTSVVNAITALGVALLVTSLTRALGLRFQYFYASLRSLVMSLMNTITSNTAPYSAR